MSGNGGHGTDRDGTPVMETLDSVLDSDDSGLCAGLIDLLALLSGAGTARWLLYTAADMGLVAAPGGYGFREVFSPADDRHRAGGTG